MCPLVLAAILGLILSKCKAQNGKCNVTPKDLFVEVGSDATVVCETSCVPGAVSWKVNNRRVDGSLARVVNSTHAELSLRNVTQRNATVECVSASEQVVGGTIIKTYSKPGKIFCILHHENGTCVGVPKLFTCNWEHLSDASPTNYTVFVSSSLVNQREICRSNVTECTARDKIRLFSDNRVTVRAETADWEAHSGPYVFIPSNIRKLCPPQLNVTVVSNHLWTAWNSTGSRCQVKYGQAVSQGPEEPVNETFHLRRNGTDWMKVESCSHYKVSARCALDSSDISPWSNWSPEKTVLTELNKSDVRLRLWRKIAAPDESGVREVLAMWMGIPSTCPGAYAYRVKVEPPDGTGPPSAACSASPCRVAVQRDANATVHLAVFSNRSLLAEDSVYVPATGEDLPGVSELQTSAAGGAIRISWQAPARPATGYVIDWTRDGNRYHWKESEYTNATLSELVDKTRYNITVTPVFGDKAGHGAEAPHVCSSLGGCPIILVPAIAVSCSK